MNAFTIKDLENLSGIKAHTIRIWEQRYTFLKPQRTNTNIRYYSNDELKTVLNIALLNKYGFKISHIDRMEAEEIHQKILMLTDAGAVQERLINELVKEMVDLDMEAFEQILNEYIATRGIERAVIQLIFPFLEKIGILWQTGNINAAQEHLVSNMIRQKLIVAVERVQPTFVIDKKCLLFLPEGEHHELGLLFMYYLLKSRGVHAIYLGANVPIKDAEYVAELKHPDYIFVHLTATGSGFNMDRFLARTESRFGSAKLVISGLLTHQYKKKVPDNVDFKHSLSDMIDYIASL